MSIKIVMAGAASKDFGRGTIADIMRSQNLRGRGVSLCLHDIDAEALDRMRQFAELVSAHFDANIRVESTTDRETALRDAGFVICAVERNRMPLWEQDFRVPRACGFQQILGENGGPGGLFHALRNMHIVLSICRDMERICPGALFLSFTNPAPRIIHAVRHLTAIDAAGLCHGVYNGMAAVAQYAGYPIEELEIVSAGLNHFYCILRVRLRSDGRDLLPQVLEAALADPRRSPSIYRDLIRYFGMLSYRSDDHIGEYLGWGSSYADGRWPYGQECHRVGAVTGRLSDVDAALQAGCIADDHWVRSSGEAAVDVIAAIVSGEPFHDPAVNVLNSAGYISNLPTTAVVEVPALVDSSGIAPTIVGALPESIAALMRPQCAIQDSLTEAYATRSRKALIRTLLLDPVVDSVPKAEQLTDHMLTLQEAFLPEFV